MRERGLSCGFILGSADREGGPHSLSTPPRPPLQVLSFTSRLKPENKERGRVKSAGGELEGPLQVAQARQLVRGLWKMPLTEAKELGEQTPARAGREGLRMEATRVTCSHSNHAHGQSAPTLSVQTSAKRPPPGRASSPRVPGTRPLAPPHSSQGLMSVSMATQL